MNEIVVRGPNGVTIRFPAGTDAATIDRVMREATGIPAPAGSAPVDLTRAGNPTPAAPVPFSDPVTGRITPEARNTPLLEQLAAPGPTGANAAVPAPGQPGSPFQVPTDDYTGPPPPVQVRSDGRVVSPITQGLGRAAADTVGLPFDLANLAANAGLSVADFIAERFGGNVDFRFPMVSDTLANTAANVVEDTTGYRSRTPAEMTSAERMAYDLSRYGGGAAMGAGGLRLLANARPASELPRTLDPLFRPYEGAGAVNTALRDTAIGAGAGTGIWGAEQVLGPDNVGPVSSMIAMVGGGMGGAGLYDLPTAGIPAWWAQTRRGFIDRAVPYDARGGTTSRGTAEDAARYVQEAAGGRDAALDANTRLGQVVADMGIMGAPVPPLGQATQNVGLARVERAVTDTPGGTPIIDRNREITTWAGDQLRRIAPDADPNVFPAAAADTIQQRTGEARANVAAAEADVQNAVDLRRQGAAPVVAAPGQRDAAALQIDDTVINKALVPMSEQSRQMYGAVDPRREAMVDVSPLQDLATEIARNGGQLADPARTLPGGLLRRINQIGLDAEGKPTQPVEVPIGEIVDVLPAIGDAARTAFDNGNPVLGRNLRDLKNAFEGILEEAGAAGVEAGVRFQQAQANWRDTIGQTLGRPGTVSDDLRTNFNRDQTNRGFSPPSQTAGQYLRRGQPENAADLVRIYDQTADPGALLPAAQTFITAAAASSIVRDGVVDPAALRGFMTEWGSVIDAVPGLRQQFDQMLDQAARGEALQGDLAQRLTQAQGNLQLTQEQINDSALSIVAGRSPRRAVEALMSAPDPAAAARELRAQLAGVPGADESLQRAVADWLFAKVTNTNPAQTTDATRPVSFSKLVNLTENPDVTALLAEVFDSPEAMNALQQVRTVLDLRGIIGAAQGTPGSPTAANLQMQFRLFEAGLRTMFGGFTGGNYARNFRVAFDVLFNKDRQKRVVDLVARAQIDPRIASHLLTLPVADDPVAWASQLGKLMRWAEFSRQMWEQDGAEPPP